jgi:anaerobic selenocysteine-containing dehydrogenase
MGVPGSGKSTVATRLIQEQPGGGSVQVVSYDDLFDEIAERKVSSDGPEGSGGESGGFDVSAWHASRQEALGRAAVLLQAAHEEARNCGSGSGDKAGKVDKNGGKAGNGGGKAGATRIHKVKGGSSGASPPVAVVMQWCLS